MIPLSTKSIDLSLLVYKRENDRYKVVASSSHLDTNPTAILPYANVRDNLIPNADKLRHTSLPTLDEVKDLGRWLFEALICDQVRDMYRMLEGRNFDRLNFHLVLDLQPHLLQRLPWECMYDPFWGEFISLRDNTHIIRKVQRKQEVISRKTTQGYTNLIIAVTNARGQPTIMPQRERDLIDEAVGPLHYKGLLNRRYIQGSQKEIKEALSEVPDVFHFVGHGGFNKNNVPGLYLEDQGGDAVHITATELENEYFTPPPEIDRRINLVILSACQTSETPKTEGYNSLAHQLASQVDTVLAMQYPIGLENLTEFNKAFYLVLANGAPLETAVNTARRSIIRDKPGGARDWIAPVLVTHQETATNLLRLISENPFKGRKHYDLNDRERFFGRDSELIDLDELYKTQKVVVIRGKSGCGKTSLLKAGWMGRAKSAQQPMVYLMVSEDLETQLRLEINKVLSSENQLPLPDGELDQLTGEFPQDLAIILDRFEQVELLSEQIDQIVTALIQWAVNPAPENRRARLVIATRLNERGEEPKLLQNLLPDEEEIKRMNLEMLGWDQAIECIESTTRKTEVSFPLETVHAILNELNYNQPTERNMTAMQVVCMEVYKRARNLPNKIATPLLVENQVEGILEQEFNIKVKLKKIVDEKGEAARKVLAQFIGSDMRSMRPRSWDDLQLRCHMDERELSSVLDMLQEEGLVVLEPQPLEEKYELVHETLTQQIDWLEPSEIELRNLEEIVESTQTLIPLKSEKGGLEDLDKQRDELILSGRHLQLVLRSALEAGHETDYWFKRIRDPQLALSVLTSDYLSIEAQIRACKHIGVMGSKEGEFGERAREKLLEWACASEIPNLSYTAGLVLAPLVNKAFIDQHFGSRGEGLKRGEIDALAIMYDSHWLPLKGLAAAARKQVRLKILKDNSFEILTSVLRAAMFGAMGFGLAVVWLYAQIYRDRPSLPPLPVLILELFLTGMLAFILALPGVLCAPLVRDLSALLSGGRRKLPAALGTVLGSALGSGLVVVIIAALAEYRDPSLIRLGRYFVSAALWGTFIGLPWLLHARFSLKWIWVVLLAGLCGGVLYWGVSQWDYWWPQTSNMLTSDGSYSWWTRMVAGILVGLGSAIGLEWGKLRTRS